MSEPSEYAKKLAEKIGEQIDISEGYDEEAVAIVISAHESEAVRELVEALKMNVDWGEMTYWQFADKYGRPVPCVAELQKAVLSKHDRKEPR